MTGTTEPQPNGGKNVDAPAEMEIDTKEVIGSTGGDEEVEAMETEENTGKEATEVEGKEEEEDSHKPDEAETGEQTPKAKKTPRKKKEIPYSPPPSTRPQRERKTAERFHVEDTRVSKVIDVAIKPGGGTPLKNIPNIVTKMSKKTRNDDILVMFHSLLYSKRVKPNMLRKNILEFSGFPWKGNETKEREKVKDKLERYTKEGLHQLLDILVLPKGGKKDEQIERILDFLQKPVDLGNSIKESKKRKTPAKSAAKNDKKPPKSGGKAKIVSDEDEEEEEEKESPPAKRPRTSSKSMPGSPSGTEMEVDQGKRKATPTEPVLRKRINDLLQASDLKTVSVDVIIETLESHFVGDLHKKKDLIKRLMDEKISAMEEEGLSNDEGEGAEEKIDETKEKEDSEKAKDSPQAEAPADVKMAESEEIKDLTMNESNSKVEPENEEPVEVVMPATENEKEKEPEIEKVKGEMEVDGGKTENVEVKTENVEVMEPIEEKTEKSDEQQEPEVKEPQQDEKFGDAVVEEEKIVTGEEQTPEEKLEGEKKEPAEGLLEKREVDQKETPGPGDQQAEKLPELIVKVGKPTEVVTGSVEGSEAEKVSETEKVETILADQEKPVEDDDREKKPSSEPVTTTKDEGEAPVTLIVEGETAEDKTEAKEEVVDKEVES